LQRRKYDLTRRANHRHNATVGKIKKARRPRNRPRAVCRFGPNEIEFKSALEGAGRFAETILFWGVSIKVLRRRANHRHKFTVGRI
jgi:hypothetical protein